MTQAFIVGAGQIGHAVADTLIDAGWRVTIGSRHPVRDNRWEWVRLDRQEADGLPQALGQGADLLIDTIGFDAPDADQLLQVQSVVGHIVTISSASVYRDDRGRTLDEASLNGFPTLPEPMTEAQPTVSPGPHTYSTRKVAMERRLLDGARIPASVLRPCAIYGLHSRHPREWWFVKRLLDGRLRIPLAHAGRSRFQTSATVNIAALAAAIAARRAGGIFNAADPTAPPVMEIGSIVMAAIGRHAELIAMPADAPEHIGTTPWSVPKPFVLSDAAGRAVGYAPVATYAQAAPSICRWLAGTPARDWQARFPQLAGYPRPLFDYGAEDAAL